MIDTIYETTLKNNLCVGCGICVVSCPTQAIHMKCCNENYLRPEIVTDKCVNCGLCSKYCPNSFERLISESRKVAGYDDYNKFGIAGARYFVAYVKNDEERLRSASGGIATYISKYLLTHGLVDAVVHAEMIAGTTGEQHYQACVSKSVEELDSRRRSFYCTISFNKVLERLKEKNDHRILVLGTPCVVRGIRNLLDNHNSYSHIEKVYTIALACSHNVNGMFTDYLADSLGIDRDIEYTVDLRHKDGHSNANNFHNYFHSYGSSYGSSDVLCDVNRFESEFTEQWRNYSFSMPVCNACSDFWGYTADISVKDAWGKWSSDPLAQSIVIVRNAELLDIFIQNPDLAVEEETEKTIIASQKETVDFKQGYAAKRVSCRNASEFDKISFLHRTNAYMREFSKNSYFEMRNDKYDKRIYTKAKQITLKKRIHRKLHKVFNKVFRADKVIRHHNKVRSFKDKRNFIDKILVVGGYGYQNVGDEAQLNVVIDRLNRCFPDYDIKVLTPDQNYTMKTHTYGNVGEAPRVAFFKEGESYLYRISNFNHDKGFLKNFFNFVLQILFLLKSEWIYFNGFLVKHNAPTFLVSASTSSLLYDIKTTKLVYFEGGGYLTGKTLSRLWDGILMCRLANLFEVPVAMSGQTIGVWDTNFNRWYAHKGFKSVGLISLRDPSASLEALREIGIKGEHIYPVCDDALFCSKETDHDIIASVFAASDCNIEFRTQGYVAINLHYWGMGKEEQRKDTLAKLYKIISLVLSEMDCNILLIPMVPSDEQAMSDYLREYPDNRIRVLKYKYDFNVVRAVISEAKLCITMKHHPIIFSVGEVTPVISLNLSDYYEHKNRGAMQILNVERFSVTLSDKDYFDHFSECLRYILDDYDLICDGIRITLKELNKKTDEFESDLTQLLK